MRHIFKSLFLLSTVLLVTFAFSTSLSAQEDSVGLTISPVVFEINGDPGDLVTNELKVFNPTDTKLNVTMKVEDFSPVGTKGQVVLSEPEENSTFSLAAWTSAFPEEFTLGPKEEKMVQFAIQVPLDAEPGGHYGSIVASLSGGTPEVTGSAVGSDRGTLVLMRVSGNVEEELVLDTFTTESFYEYGPIPFNVIFENVGNVHVRPGGFISITNSSGKEVTTLEITENNVIPGAKREAEAVWEEKNLIGRYTATLVANYGSESSKVLTETVTFTVFPWKVALAITAGVVLLLVVLLKSRKRLVKATKVLVGK